MNKSLFKGISLVLSVVLILGMLPINTAFAAGVQTNAQSGISLEGETEPAPSVSEEPSPVPEPSQTVQPEPTLEPTSTTKPEPSVEPSTTIQPEPSSKPSPSIQPIPLPEPSTTIQPEQSTNPTPIQLEPTPEPSGQPTEDTNTWPLDVSLQSLLDENGFLTDEALKMLQPLSCDTEKFTEITDLGDGKHAMKLFTEPIKFQNEDGEYELIDNSIIATDPNEDSDHEFKNAASDVIVLMSDNLNEDSAIEINYKDYSIGFKPLNIIKKNSGTDDGLNFIINDKSEKQEVEKVEKDNGEYRNDGIINEISDDVLDGAKDYESVEYTETFNEKTDIKITPTLTGMKEDIILYEIPDEAEFSYELSVKNMTPVLRQDGNLYFIDIENGILVAAIPAPFMYDSKEEYSESYDVGVKLEQTGESTYKYTLVPDRKFLEDKNTVYPVVIDPATTISGGAILDTFTTSRYSGNNYVNDANLKVGYGSDLKKSRGLVKIGAWPISQTGYEITYADYRAYQNYSGSSSPIMQLARITSNDWDPNTVTWANQPAEFEVSSQQTVQAVGWYTWNITDLVRAWYYNWVPNFGMYIKIDNEGSSQYKRFYSTNSGTSPSYFYIEFYDPVPSTPNISTSPNASASWTNNTTPALYWSGATDKGSLLNCVQYNVDGSGWNNLWAAESGGSYINVGGSGGHTIYVRCVDNWGNVGGTNAIGYYVDVTAPSTPTISTTPNASASWTNNQYPVLNWSGAADSHSGLNRVEYNVDGGAWVNLGAAYSGGTQIYVGGSGGHTINVRCVDNMGYGGTPASMGYCVDVTGPNPSSVSVSKNDGAYGSGDTATIQISVTAVSDAQSGVQAYKVYRFDTSGKVIGTGPVGTLTPTQVANNEKITLNNQADNTEFYFKVEVIDNCYTSDTASPNNLSWSPVSNSLTTADRTGPTVPTIYLTVGNSTDPLGNNYTNDTSPTIHWSGVQDPSNDGTEGSHGVKRVEYSFTGDPNGDWIPIGFEHGTIDQTTDIYSGSFDIDCSSSSIHEGENTIWLRGVDNFDSHGNPGTPAHIVYNKDTSIPNAKIMPLANSDVYGEVTLSVTMNDDKVSGQNHFSGWVLEYGEGEDPSVYHEVTHGTTPVTQITWDTSALPERHSYTVRLRALDSAGNDSSTDENNQEDTILVKKIYNSTSVPAQLNITNPGTSEITNQSVTVQYSGQTGIDDELLIGNEIVEGGLTFDTAQYGAASGEFAYPEGSTLYMYVHGRDGDGNDYYSCETHDNIIFSDKFDNNNQIVIDPEYINKLDISSSKIQLAKYDTNNHYLSAEFTSDFEPFSGDIRYFTLNTVQTTQQGTTSITYSYTLDGTNWTEILPFTKVYLNHNVDNIKVKAILTTTDPLATPEIDKWELVARTITDTVDLDPILNDFNDSERGLVNLSNVEKRLGKIELVADDLHMHAGEGSFMSETKNLGGNIKEVKLNTVDTAGSGTSIEYLVSADGGTNWKKVLPGVSTGIDNTGKKLILKAVLKTTDSSKTPSIDGWSLHIVLEASGQAYTVNLIDAPANLTAQANVNYKTLLRWDASTTQGVTYNVYRDTTPYYTPSDKTLIKSDIAENYWSDYNLNYGKTFYYKVTAVKSFDGTNKRESLPTNDAKSKVVDETEIHKQLGLEDYWGYAAFQTGSGQGYVNVSKGNLSYITTDLVISDPFLAMVMRRTYNSQAKTETALGTGWDFSFNTCLLKECTYVDGQEVPVAMILKDGDGSFHRFEGNDQTGYTPAKGTFMTLSKVNNEYVIERKDYIKYHFNGDTLKLSSFSDINGNTLSFTYDSRGNVDTVTNNVGDTLTLHYTNDMLDTVTSLDGRAYNYHYDPITGKFDYMETAVEDGAYRESFTYDENGILETITDPRNYRKNSGKHTTIDCDAAGKVLKITDASGEWYMYDYTDTLPDVSGIDTTTVTRKWSYNGTERTGAVMGYKYNTEGLILEKIDPAGNSTTYENIEYYYLVESVTHKNQDSNGNYYWVKNYYEYDGNNNNITRGNITHITAQSSTDGVNFTPLTVSIANSTEPAQSPETIITYDTKYLNKPKTKKVKILDGATDATDKWALTTYIYEDNAQGKLETATEAITVDTGKTKTSISTYGSKNGHWGYLLSVIDNFGKKTEYEYYPKGQVQYVKEYNNDNVLIRTVTEYAYDNYGRTDWIKDAMGNKTDVDYDILGRKIKETYPDPQNEFSIDYVQWQYDLSGNLEYTIDRSNNRTDYQYDDLNRLERTDYADKTFDTVDYSHRWDSNEDGTIDSDVVVKTTGQYSGADGLGLNEGNGITTNEYYDLMGRLKKSTQGPEGSEVLPVVYDYDLVGNMIHVTDAAGRKSEAQYDKLGRKIRVILDPDNVNIETETGYDLLGNVLTSEDGEHNITKYTYDYSSRVKTVTQTLNSREITTSYSYDNLVTLENGQTVIMNKTTDAMGCEKLTYFDEMGRKLTEINDGITTDNENIKTEYHYNNNFMPRVVVRNDGTMEKYTYNALNQVEKIEYYKDKPNDGITMTWQGLDDGSYTVTPDNKIVYQYHESGNVQTQTLWKDDTVAHITGYNYDNMNRMFNVQESAGQGGLYISYGYDYMNVVSNITYKKDNVDKIIGYSYDALGRLSQVSLGDDKVRGYEYNLSTGELLNVNNYRQFEQTPTDENDHRFDDYIQEHYDYDTLGRIDLFTYTDYNYDDTTQALTTAQKESYDLSYYDNGFIKDENIVTNYGSTATTNKHYVYDTLGRLDTVSVNGTEKANYDYDDVGNRIVMTEGTTHYDYIYDTTGFNLLDTVNKNDILDQRYFYDDRGNQKQEQIQKDFDGTIKTLTTDYTYDLMNQMTQAIISAQGETTIISQNVYNVSGQRVSRIDGTWTDASDGGVYDNNVIDKDEDGLVVASEITGADTSRYYYTGGVVLYSADETNSLLTENILDPSGSIIASKRFDQQYPGYYFYDYDYRGSTTAIIAPNGTLVKAYTYDEYGKMQETTQTNFNNEVTFTSSVTDESTGLQYMNSRFYNPSTGRFLSQDTYTGNAYEPWTQHLYSYCGNNPTNFIDPTGHRVTITGGDSQQEDRVQKEERRKAKAKKTVKESQAYKDIANAVQNNVNALSYSGFGNKGFEVQAEISINITLTDTMYMDNNTAYESYCQKCDNKDRHEEAKEDLLKTYAQELISATGPVGSAISSTWGAAENIYKLSTPADSSRNPAYNGGMGGTYLTAIYTIDVKYSSNDSYFNHNFADDINSNYQGYLVNGPRVPLYKSNVIADNPLNEVWIENNFWGF